MWTSSLNGNRLNDVANTLCGIGSQFESVAEKPEPSGYSQPAHEPPTACADEMVESWLSEIAGALAEYPCAVSVTFEVTMSNSGSSVDVLAEITSGKEAEIHEGDTECDADITVTASSALDADLAAALLGPHYGRSSFRRKCDGGR